MTASSIFLMVAAAAMSVNGFVAEPELSAAARDGQRLYDYYCQDCHGTDAAGNGPTAAVLSIKPANLTMLSKKNDGKFPLERVTQSIDGRQRTAAHGSKMPIWGLGFQDPSSDANQEQEVRSRIEQLIAYLRTLQR